MVSEIPKVEVMVSNKLADRVVDVMSLQVLNAGKACHLQYPQKLEVKVIYRPGANKAP